MRRAAIVDEIEAVQNDNVRAILKSALGPYSLTETSIHVLATQFHRVERQLELSQDAYQTLLEIRKTDTGGDS